MEETKMIRDLAAVIDIEPSVTFAAAGEGFELEAVESDDSPIVMFDINGTDVSIVISREPERIRLLVLHRQETEFKRIDEWFNRSKRIEQSLSGGV